MAVVKRAVAPALVPVNFLDMGMYSGGAYIPDGNYILFHNIIMHQATDKQGTPKGPARLGCMVDFFPFDNPVEEAKLQQFYSMGSKAHESFAPNPDTGKGLVLVPGSKGGNLNDKTNWFEYLKGFFNSGLPEGIGLNDISAIDGTHAHITNVEEPADRQSFQSNTSEVEQAQRKPGKIAVVTEILEGGAPWEGGGGIPEAGVATSSKLAPKLVGNPAKAPVKITPKAPVSAPEPETDDLAELKDLASDAMANELAKAPATGFPRATLRTKVFTAIKKSHGEEVASSIVTNFFENEDNLAVVLGEMGYSVQGLNVKPAA